MRGRQDLLKLPKFWTILLIFSFTTTEILGARQTITAYDDYGCTGNSVIYLDTVDVNETSWVAEAESFKILGLWKITGSKEVIVEGKPEMEYKELIVAKEWSSSISCFKKYQMGFADYNFTRFEKFGPEETSNSTLMLFSEMNLKGESDIVHDELPNLESNEIQCFAQFSNKHWIYYPEALFQGTPKCLCGYYDWLSDPRRSTRMEPDGLQYFNTQPGIKIGSVRVDNRYQCNCPHSSEVGPPGTTTTSTSTTTTTPRYTRTTTEYFYSYRGFDYNYLYFLFLLIIPLTCVIYCCCKQTTFARREIVVKLGTGPPPPPPTSSK